jgi:hypothetical protein
MQLILLVIGKFLFFIPFILLPFTSFQGPGIRRDLSAPSKRIIGHWINEKDWQCYYGPIDPETKLGNYAQIVQGEAFYSHYRVISEELIGNRIIIDVEVQSGDTSFSLRTWIIDKDGNEMVRADFSSNSWKYVDDLELPSN